MPIGDSALKLCGNCGNYESVVIVEMPTHWTTERRTRFFQVDACIWPEVERLISAGIRTIESCCGHGGREGYIAVDESDAGAMEIRGYWRIEGKPGFYRPLQEPIHIKTNTRPTAPDSEATPEAGTLTLDEIEDYRLHSPAEIPYEYFHEEVCAMAKAYISERLHSGSLQIEIEKLQQRLAKEGDSNA